MHNFIINLKHQSISVSEMQLKDVKKLELPASGDFHVHLRDGAMMETVVPSIREGGVDVVYVMVCPDQASGEHACGQHHLSEKSAWSVDRDLVKWR